MYDDITIDMDLSYVKYKDKKKVVMFVVQCSKCKNEFNYDNNHMERFMSKVTLLHQKSILVPMQNFLESSILMVNHMRSRVTVIEDIHEVLVTSWTLVRGGA
jgi:hypothetical protein